MDLSTLDIKKQAEQGVKMYFQHPITKEPLSVFAVVLGTDSSVSKAHMRKSLLRRMDRDANATIEKKEEYLVEAEQYELEATIDLIKAIGDDDVPEGEEPLDYIVFGDKKIKNNKRDLKKLLTQLTWMKDQINAYTWDRSNFLE